MRVLHARSMLLRLKKVACLNSIVSVCFFLSRVLTGVGGGTEQS